MAPEMRDARITDSMRYRQLSMIRGMASAMRYVDLRYALLLFVTVTLACDTPTRSSSVAGVGDGSPSTPVLNLTGTWSGTATDSSGQVQITWQLVQTDSEITGTVTATTTVGAPLYTGTVTGRVVATGLTFTVSITRGSISGLPECSLALTGSVTDVQAGSMAGIYTGTHSCAGAVQDGRLMLVKQ
jgi:hypothetical protein